MPLSDSSNEIGNRFRNDERPQKPGRILRVEQGCVPSARHATALSETAIHHTRRSNVPGRVPRVLNTAWRRLGGLGANIK